MSFFRVSLIATLFTVATALRMTMMAEKSQAMPFLNRPSGLGASGSMVGDVGFDPLGFSEQFNVNYARAAELKHGRVAMLATVGFVAQQSFHVIGDADPFKAIDAVGYMANVQILGAVGLVELATWDKTFSSTNPGDYGFDPLGQLKGKSAKQVEELKLKEIKNGRLAMVAIIGMFVQYLSLGKLGPI